MLSGLPVGYSDLCLANGLFAAAAGVGFVALHVGRVFETVVAQQH
jgi:hypothetical protein